MHIRPATPADAAALALIGAATFLETFAGVLEGGGVVAHCARVHAAGAYAAFLAGGAWAWLVEVDGAPVGYALLGAPDLPGAEAGDLELKRIYLLSRFHGGGAGRGLLDAVLAAARAEGAKRLLLGVYAGNARAQGFYTRAGFARIGERRFCVGNRDYDDVVMALDL